MSQEQRRVALVGDAGFYVGPELARHLAARGHDLVLGDPAPELVDELVAAGVAVEVVERARNLTRPDSAARLVAAALDRFGRLDAAVAFSGQIVTGRFVDSTLEDLQSVVASCLEAPYHFLKAVVDPMVAAGERPDPAHHLGAGARPTPGAPAVLGGAGGGHHAGPQRGRRGGPQRRAGQRGGHQLHGLP